MTVRLLTGRKVVIKLRPGDTVKDTKMALRAYVGTSRISLGVGGRELKNNVVTKSLAQRTAPHCLVSTAYMCLTHALLVVLFGCVSNSDGMMQVLMMPLLIGLTCRRVCCCSNAPTLHTVYINAVGCPTHLYNFAKLFFSSLSSR